MGAIVALLLALLVHTRRIQIIHDLNGGVHFWNTMKKIVDTLQTSMWRAFQKLNHVGVSLRIDYCGTQYNGSFYLLMIVT